MPALMPCRSGPLAILVTAAALLLPGTAYAVAGKVGEQAPPFPAIELDGGQPVTLEGRQGTAVLLNKWSTWCRPCVEEMPFLERLHQRYRARGFMVVGVAVDRGGASGKVRGVAQMRAVSYPIWLDPEDAFTSTFRSTGVPESILIDRNGVVVRRWPGALSKDDTTIGSAIARAIASTGSYVPAASKEAKESAMVTFGLLGILAAVAAGLLSFLSPCVLPLVPSYAAFLTGVSAKDAAGRRSRRGTTLVHAGAFVLGFSLVFVLLGLSATAVGGAFREYGEWISRAGGVLLLAFGLVLLGVIRLPILQRDVRLLERTRGLRRFGPVGSGVVGAAFGAGWTPCIGPALAGILALAATSGNTGEGVALLSAYSAGLAIPFLAAAVAVERFTLTGPRVQRWMPRINRISGALLLTLGALLISGEMTRLSGWFAQFAPSWMG